MKGFSLSLPLGKVVTEANTQQPTTQTSNSTNSNVISSVPPLISKLNISLGMPNTPHNDISEDEGMIQKPTDSFFSSISIDNEPVEIESIVKLQSSSPQQYTSNIKIYECYDDSPIGTDNKPWKRDFKSRAFPLLNGRDSKFKLSSCYIVIHLFVHSDLQSKKRDETRDENNFRMIEQLFTWGTIGSLRDHNNDLSFTPRGLEHPFSSSRIDQNKFNFDLYVWYGKESTDFVKSRTVEKALRLEYQLQQPSIVENLFTSGKPQSFEELIKSNSATFTSNESPQITKNHLLSRIRSLMLGGASGINKCKFLFEELSSTPSDENSNERLNSLLQLRKRPMAGVINNHEDSLESPRKKERTQLSPINTHEVEHVEEPKVMSGRELAKACHYVCSKITDFLFLGSAAVAQDKKKLNDNGITHIINAAASVYCDNYFPDDFTYYSLSLYDDPNESIIGSFYGVIEFIENAIKKGGKIYVHCQMGVSRSCCLCISYMMWKYRMNFNQALEDVKSKRACCSPNAGFLVQLTQWETILGLSDKTKKEPHAYLYRISPLNNFYAIHKELVPKLCHNTRHLDSRTCFLLQSKIHLFLWVGSQSTNELLTSANRFIEILRSYSPNSLNECIQIQEGQENDTFNQILNSIEIDTRRTPTEYQDLKYLQMTQEDAMELMKQIKTTEKPVDPETEKEMKNYKTGTLYSYEDGSFSEFDYFDSEDILDDMCYVMLPEDEDHILVMIGYDVDLGDDSLDDKGEEIGELFMEWRKLPESTSIRVCEEDDPDFFRYFKNG